ncbi:hypothetical protein ACLB2K_073189 [Fragaria x ananassa]
MEMEMEIVHDQLTFWCHVCDMSVTLPATTVACPHCFSDLLELMDYSTHAPEADRLNSPLLRRLLHHLSAADVLPPPPANVYLLPASKAYVDVIPTVKMTSRSMTVCAVCKEQFAEDAEAKQLACSHVYHPDCILPWLSSRSSCPLCRFQLPTDVDHPPDSQHRLQRLVHYRLQLHDHRNDLRAVNYFISFIQVGYSKMVLDESESSYTKTGV